MWLVVLSDVYLQKKKKLEFNSIDIEYILVLSVYKENHLFQTSADSYLRFVILCLVASVKRHWHVWYNRRCLYTDMCPFSRAKLSALLFCLFTVQTSNPLSRRICKRINIGKSSIILVKMILWGKCGFL